MTTRMRALLLVVALTAAACGGDDDDGTAGDRADPGSNTTTETGVEESEAVEFDRDATFTWATLVYPTDINPHIGAFSGASQAILTPLHDRLVYLDPVDGQLEPMLATEWETADDATSITFTLRDDVTFHDGAPFDAAAVVANVEHGLGRGAQSANATAYALMEGAETIGEHEVRFDLKGPYAGGMLEALSQGLGAYISPATLADEDPTTVAGTGPYMASEIRPGELYRMETYPDYWDPDAQNFADLEIVVETSEDTILNGIASGQYSAARLPSAMLSRAEQSAGVQVISELSNTALVLTLNTDLIEGGDDPDVLRAINTAIDREEIGDGALRGGCVPTVQPWNESHPGHNADYPGDYYEGGPDAARELLADAGYPDGITVELDTFTIPAIVPVAETLQNQLAEAGIDAPIKQLETSVLIPGFATEKTLPTFLSLLPFYQPPTNLIASRWLADGASNPGGWMDEEIEQLFPQVMAATDLDERDTLLREFSGQVVEAPSNNIIICHEVALWVGAADTVGLSAMPFGYDFRRLGIAAE